MENPSRANETEIKLIPCSQASPALIQFCENANSCDQPTSIELNPLGVRPGAFSPQASQGVLKEVVYKPQFEEHCLRLHKHVHASQIK